MPALSRLDGQAAGACRELNELQFDLREVWKIVEHNHARPGCCRSTDGGLPQQPIEPSAYPAKAHMFLLQPQPCPDAVVAQVVVQVAFFRR